MTHINTLKHIPRGKHNDLTAIQTLKFEEIPGIENKCRCDDGMSFEIGSNITPQVEEQLVTIKQTNHLRKFWNFFKYEFAEN